MSGEVKTVNLDAVGDMPSPIEAQGMLLDLLSEGKPYVFITAEVVETDEPDERKGLSLVIAHNNPNGETESLKYILKAALSQL